MRIAGVASAFPPHYYSQQQVFEALREQWKEKLDNPDVLARLHSRVGVEGRYFALPLEGYLALDRWGKANDTWLAVAEQIGEQAITCAFKRARLSMDDISALLTVSVTGIASPSLDAHLANRMGLPGAMRRTPIFGLGCVAGASGLAQAADYVRAYPERLAVLLSVELCSLTWQRGDLSVANLISCGLFGDGAAAVIVVGDRYAGDSSVMHGPEIVGSACNFYPGTEGAMGWDISEEGFRIVLSPDVPAIIREHLPADVDAFLASHDLKRSDIGAWVMHTGGPKVLEAMSGSLGLPDSACEASWESLRRVGNLSSASVLLVLEDVMMNRRPAPGTWGLLAAMGPGFCSQLVLLRW